MISSISMEKELQKYVARFAKLRLGATKFEPAPHKPVLLLAPPAQTLDLKTI